MAKELLELRGIITVLNTPFTEQDGIDEAGLRRNVDRAVAAGVAGFLVPAMASEVDCLSQSERIQMVRCVLDGAKGKCAVIGGASAVDMAVCLQNAARMIALGCDGVLVSIPWRDETDYVRQVKAVAALQPSFLMLQDWDPAGAGVPVPVIARLFEEVECLRCLKVETVPAGAKYSAVLAAAGGRLHVSGGWAVTQMIEALDRGVHAFMPTGMHWIYTRIYHLYRQGRREEAQSLFYQVLPVLAFSNQHLDISIHFFKRLLYRQGVYATPRVRAALLPFDAHHVRVADELIERVIAMETALAAPGV